MSDSRRMSQPYASPVAYAAISPVPSAVKLGTTGCPITPGSAAPTDCWVGMSHSRTAPASLPVTIVRSSGLISAA